MKKTHYKIEAIGKDGEFIATLEVFEEPRIYNHTFTDKMINRIEYHANNYKNNKCTTLELIKYNLMNGSYTPELLDKCIIIK